MSKTLGDPYWAARTHNFHVLKDQGKTSPTKKVVRTAVYNSLLSPAFSKITLFYFFFEFFLLIVAVWFNMSSVFKSYHMHMTCNLLLIFNLFCHEEVDGLNMLLCLVLILARLEIEVVSPFLSIPTLRWGHVSGAAELDMCPRRDM